MAQNSSLQNIFSQSFPGSSLFDVSLVKDTNPEIPFYKNKYFCFLSLSPGTNNGGERGFDTNNKITLKTECTKLNAFAHSLRMWARGQGKFAKFSIFVDSSKSSFGGNGGGQKMVFCSEFTPNGKGPEDRQISISFKSGSNSKPIGVFFYPSEALAIADTLEFISKKGLELEFQDRGIQVGNVKQPPKENHSKSNTLPSDQNHQKRNSRNVQESFQGAMNNVADNLSSSDNPFDSDVPFN